MNEWFELPEARRIEIFETASSIKGVPVESIEKDWWVTIALKAVFQLPASEHMVFKGGTSLSKAWGVIQRFSEDIDLAISRSFLGFSGTLSNEKVKALKKASCQYVSVSMSADLKAQMLKMGIPADQFKIEAKELKDNETDRDPQQLNVFYKSLVSQSGYLKDKIVIEIGARSELEPSETRSITSLISEAIPALGINLTFKVLTVHPKRTFIEKAFLLHEEFQKPSEKIRHSRMSRHLYDLEKLMDTDYGKDAVNDTELYNSIIVHRKKFTPIKGIDYKKHHPQTLDFIPNSDILHLWKSDYKSMVKIMIYGDSLNFEEMIERMRELQNRFRKISM
ncbi:MAG: nucleotidyl transferase AbiEii/AbiGii toxin family protein [Bacteroidetes bacterium]|nr:nucleotidyl transferase AbiEii/AbiGii toxin family protein [Bacteroidota bacterium]